MCSTCGSNRILGESEKIQNDILRMNASHVSLSQKCASVLYGATDVSSIDYQGRIAKIHAIFHRIYHVQYGYHPKIRTALCQLNASQEGTF